MNSQFPLFKLIDVEIFERPVLLRLPFRFGVVTLTQCPQAFVRVRIETVAGNVFEGVAAEMMAPKWFDKNLALTNEDNFNQLRHVLLLARDAYLAKSTLISLPQTTLIISFSPQSLAITHCLPIMALR
jgi:hypothetical protein